MANQVVVHLTDGRLLKGTTVDFYPNRPSFHLVPATGGPSVEVTCSQMKALFFVKSLQGRGHPRKAGFHSKGGHSLGKKVAVRFKDGELLCGYSLTYVQGREGFFMNPAEADGNNLRIFVIVAATHEIKTDADAEAFSSPGNAAEGKASSVAHPDSRPAAPKAQTAMPAPVRTTPYKR